MTLSGALDGPGQWKGWILADGEGYEAVGSLHGYRATPLTLIS